jgi:hypothetical protein
MPKYRLTNHLHVVAIPAKEGSLFLGIPDNLCYLWFVQMDTRLKPRV